MNNFIKQVIEEKFASKAQQRFFYAKANEKGKPKKEKKKWSNTCFIKLFIYLDFYINIKCYERYLYYNE